MQRERGHHASSHRHVPVGVQRSERDEQTARLLDGPGWRRIEERQRLSVACSPGCKLQYQAGKVDIRDLRGDVARPPAVLEFRPQPVGRPGRHAPGPARSLVSRGTGDRHRPKPGHPGAGVEPRLPRQTGVDHDPDALHGQAGLGDVGREHHLSAPARGGLDGGILLGDGQAAVQQIHVGVDTGFGKTALDAPHLAHARQEGENVAGLDIEHLPDGGCGVGVDPGVPAGWGPPHFDGVHPRVTFDDGRRGLVADQRRHSCGVDRGRHHEQAEVGTDGAAHVQGERKPQVRLQIALVELVEDDAARVGEFGVALEAPGEDALGHDLDPSRPAHAAIRPGDVAHRVAGLLAQQVRHPPCRRPGRQPPRLEHDDLPPVEPRLVNETQRNDRRLARSRRRNEHAAAVAGERTPDGGHDVFDREQRRHLARVRMA